MTTPRRWAPGDRVILAGASGDLARLEGVRATVVSGDGSVARIRFDSAKLLGGRLRHEIEVVAEWLEQEPPPVAGAI
jgi:hypothetical protein